MYSPEGVAITIRPVVAKKMNNTFDRCSLTFKLVKDPKSMILIVYIDLP